MTSGGFEERAATDALPKGELWGWLPDGQHLLVLQGATLYAVPTADGHITGAPMMLNRNLGTALHGAPSVTSLGIDRRGTLFYSLYKATSDIYVADLNPVTGKIESDPIPLQLAWPGDNVLPRWSPDGKKILYHWVQWAPAENVVYELDSGREVRVATGVPSAAICWANDGAAILAIPYVGGPSPYQGLVKISLPSGSSTLLAASSGSMIPLNCAGDWVTLATTDALRVYNVAEGKESLLYRYEAPTNTRPSLSHDGRFVATVTQVGPNEAALLVVPTAGGKARELVRLTRPVEFQQTFFVYTWSPDDHYIYFLKRPRAEAPYALFRIPSSGGAQESIGLQFPELRDIDISPDAKKIAFSVGDPVLREVWAVENVMLAAPR
jgi:Tol biopolymer transport system component